RAAPPLALGAGLLSLGLSFFSVPRCLGGSILPPAVREGADMAVSSPATGEEPFRYVHSAEFPALLERLPAALLHSTYQAGKLLVVRAWHHIPQDLDHFPARL